MAYHHHKYLTSFLRLFVLLGPTLKVGVKDAPTILCPTIVFIGILNW